MNKKIETTKIKITNQTLNELDKILEVLTKHSDGLVWDRSEVILFLIGRVKESKEYQDLLKSDIVSFR